MLNDIHIMCSFENSKKVLLLQFHCSFICIHNTICYTIVSSWFDLNKQPMFALFQETIVRRTKLSFLFEFRMFVS